MNKLCVSIVDCQTEKYAATTTGGREEAARIMPSTFSITTRMTSCSLPLADLVFYFFTVQQFSHSDTP